MEELKDLRQVGSVHSYLIKFEELLNIIEISDGHILSLFMGGLKGEIKDTIKLLRPANLQEAISLAKIQEAAIENALRRGKSVARVGNVPLLSNSKKPIESTSVENTNRNSKSSGFRPFKKMSSGELEEKRRKGLCYWCDEKYTTGHTCKMKKLYSFEVIGDEEVEEDEEMEIKEPEGDTESSEETSAIISMKALSGIQTLADYNTMRVSGSVNGQKVHILIDSGSTHNFIDQFTAQQLGCEMTDHSPMTVVVANGEKIKCDQICSGLRWRMQGVEFTSDFMILPLEGCQVVLGIQWLILLGSILWNFSELRMEFKVNHKKVVLRGSPQPRMQMMQCKSLVKSLRLPSELCHAKLCSLVMIQEDQGEKEGSNQGQTQLLSSNQAQLDQLLQSYEDVFREVEQLPPVRCHDHKITLKEGTDPISVRPYRYPAFQKNIIEEMVKEMLNKGIIRPSSSPFSAPIVLVRKKDNSWRLCIDY